MDTRAPPIVGCQSFARDNVCTLAEDVVESTGELSRFFGPGDGNLQSDFVWALFNSDAAAQESFAELDRDMQELLRGYAAGYNRYLRDTGVSALAEPCRDAPWVRSITELDMLKVLNKLTLRAGVASFIDALVGAEPPAAATAAIDAEKAAPAASVGSAAEAQRLLAQTDLPTWDVHAFGSNAIALGRDLTNDGRGALLGNPHFPWFGMNRFHAVHLTIPGRYDAMGAAIYGFPLVNVGFNRFAAWSHTVSTARRFVVRELTLAPGDPTSYVYDGEVVPMTTETVTVDVLHGYTPIFAGSSYIQTVRWAGNWPDVRAIVTYSQSTDPDSPHFSDMTQVFSDQGWVAFPYRMRDIQRDLVEHKFLREQR